MRLLIMLLYISRVHPELQVKHNIFVSRKSRSYLAPSGQNFYYSNYDSDYEYSPGSHGSDSRHGSFEINKDSMDSTVPSYIYHHPPVNEHSIRLSDIDIPHTTVTPVTTPWVTEHYEEPTTKYDIDYERIKSEARYNSRFLPSKFKSDIMYERLKSLMHYKPYSDHKIDEIEFDISNKYHSDDGDDIRTTSTTNNDIFPYFYHGPYEFEYDSNADKAKEKRYTADKYHSVIPVHENISDDIPPNYHYSDPIKDPPIYTATTESSPVAGDTGFFSYVLNDYFDKASDEDPLTFHGVGEWGKNIQYDSNYYDDDHRLRSHPSKNDYRYHPTPNYINKDVTAAHGGYDTGKRHIKTNYNFYTTPSYINNDEYLSNGDSVTESGHTSKSEYNKGAKTHESKSSDKVGYENNAAGHKSFKDIADSLAHKFGSENHARDTKHKLKHNQDRGENKRGFHRIYHKDEFMEDKEYFDNSNSSSRGEDKGSSSVRNGGSEAVLKSLATAHLGDESNAVRHAGDRENKQSKNSSRGHSSSKAAESEFKKYRDLAKKTADGYSDYGGRF
ncbi:uncharacterized protein LOC106134409 [Amyelois transitella]|uniref:uncharacterized protein LOC106134409 n=1 Tax=Amyelois transitella TaxID=680683 RepID=UPI0029906801|nr:uncharacterized protein LOC106134409 [Amyelois transitella]